MRSSCRRSAASPSIRRSRQRPREQDLPQHLTPPRNLADASCEHVADEPSPESRRGATAVRGEIAQKRVARSLSDQLRGTSLQGRVDAQSDSGPTRTPIARAPAPRPRATSDSGRESPLRHRSPAGIGLFDVVEEIHEITVSTASNRACSSTPVQRSQLGASGFALDAEPGGTYNGAAR
jgi:hypothetical protein